MLATILELLKATSPIWVPLVTGLVGWLVPSPFQKKKSAEQAIADAFDQAAKTGRP